MKEMSIYMSKFKNILLFFIFTVDWYCVVDCSYFNEK